jgi:phosphate transport system protein
MSHYEERLEADLEKIRAQVARMGEAVEDAVRDACRALLTADQDLAAQTILGDISVNNDSRELDRLCHVFVALHVPSAGHLRFISSVLRLSIALERIGDYAETISRTAVQLSDVPPRMVAGDIEIMADQSCRLLHLAMESFNERNPDVARGTLEMSGQFASTSDKVFEDLLVEGEKGQRPLSDMFALLATFNRLERIIHQAKNICEETIFAATGETKQPKVFDILFLDEKNDGVSQLAEHLARKVFSQGGTYASAGWAPAKRVDPEYVEFAGKSGIDLSQARPDSYREEMADRLADFDIVIALQPGGRDHIPKLPFHTVFLQWHIDAASGPEETYKQLVNALSELMEKLRGNER